MLTRLEDRMDINGFCSTYSDALVVANSVLTRFPMIPCRPILALMNAMAANPSVLVHVGPFVEKLDWPPFQRRMAAAMVNSACNTVPKKSQTRVRGPIWSPIRPRNAPERKAITEVRA